MIWGLSFILSLGEKTSKSTVRSLKSASILPVSSVNIYELVSSLYTVLR